MPVEIEVKFLGLDFTQIRKKLKQLRARKMEKGFECTEIWDTPNLRLRREKKLLRLRLHGNYFSLGYKEKIPGKAGFKTVYEIDVDITPDQKTRLANVFEKLGFQIRWKYDIKYEQWKLHNCLIDLDELPFLKCMEIEGKPTHIQACAKQLGLNWSTRCTKSYGQLFKEWSAHQGKSWKNCVFPGKKHGRIKKTK